MVISYFALTESLAAEDLVLAISLCVVVFNLNGLRMRNEAQQAAKNLLFNYLDLLTVRSRIRQTSPFQFFSGTFFSKFQGDTLLYGSSLLIGHYKAFVYRDFKSVE